MPGGSGGGNKHHHRSGGLKQSNKRNKRSKASKRSALRGAGAGKTSGGGGGGGGSGGGASASSSVASQSKLDRRHRQQQIRQNKKQLLLRKRRGLDTAGVGTAGVATTVGQQGGGPPPPRVVGIVSLGPDQDIEDRLRDHILQDADLVVAGTPSSSRPSDDDGDDGASARPTDDKTTRTTATATATTVSCKFNVHKKQGNLTLLTSKSAFPTAATTTTTGADDIIGDNNNNSNNHDAAVFAALDLARVCDLLLFVIDSSSATPYSTMIDREIQIGSSSSSSDAKNKKSQQQQQQSINQWDHLISARGDAMLAAIKAQGLPTPLTVWTYSATDDAGDVNNNGDDDDHMTIQTTKSIRRSHLKRHADLKNYVARFATTEFGSDHDKVVSVGLSSPTAVSEEGDDNNVMVEDGDDDTKQQQTNSTAATTRKAAMDRQMLVRTLCTMSCSPAKWVATSPRAYILSDDYRYDAATRELRVTGYVRGIAPFDINALVHVPTCGTFACKSLCQAQRPLVERQRKKKANIGPAAAPMNTTEIMEGGNDGTRTDDTLVTSDPELRESLVDMFATPNALDGEQNLIGFDDTGGDDGSDPDQDGEDQKKKTEGSTAARPAGWSDYQSAWLDAIDEKDAIEEEGGVDHGELAAALNKKGSSTGSQDGVGVAASVGGAADAMDVDDDDALPDSSMMEQRRKERLEHQEFPDEVQVDEEGNAQERFARYRSLKSFRKSYWDPKENLPDSYATIYQFSNFKATQRSVMKEMKEVMRAGEAVNGQYWGKTIKTTSSMDVAMGDDSDDDDMLEGLVPSGSYIQLTLQSVPADAVQAVRGLVTAVSLLPHENKVSVLQMGLSSQIAPASQALEDNPVKSKDELIFRCGWRTWRARPVFSQNNLNCDKHKFERFLPPNGTFFAASIFGPVTYTPSPVLVFRNGKLDGPNGINGVDLIAAGSMIGADADRIAVKRIILTGYPVRVHKRWATVKYMFYNPDDVRWFKPAGLYTKHGLQGNIVQSVGEHGTMKCLFNAPIKQHDTVCLPLYKRIYPKFATDRTSQQSGNDDKTIVGKSVLVVR